MFEALKQKVQRYKILWKVARKKASRDELKQACEYRVGRYLNGHLVLSVSMNTAYNNLFIALVQGKYGNFSIGYLSAREFALGTAYFPDYKPMTSAERGSLYDRIGIVDLKWKNAKTVELKNDFDLLLKENRELTTPKFVPEESQIPFVTLSDLSQKNLQ